MRVCRSWQQISQEFCRVGFHLDASPDPVPLVSKA